MVAYNNNDILMVPTLPVNLEALVRRPDHQEEATSLLQVTPGDGRGVLPSR